MTAGEKLSAEDPVVIDLDTPGDDVAAAGGPGTPATGDDTGRPVRARRIVAAAAGVGVLALGVFLGHTNARNAADAEIRVFTGDIVIGNFSTSEATWQASLSVINDSTSPVEVVGLDLPGYELVMMNRASTVPASGRSAVPVTIAADCTNAPGATDETPPVTITVARSGVEHDVETAVSLAPAGAAAMLQGQCQGAGESLAARASLEVSTIDTARPIRHLATRVAISLGRNDLAAEVTGLRSLLPGFTLTADDLPATVGSRATTTFIDAAWTVSNCMVGTTADVAGNRGPQVTATIRTEVDGTVTDTAVQGYVGDDIMFQLGLLAASRCAT